MHLCKYPESNEKLIDKQLSENMNLTYAYTELGRSARNAFNLKIRQPLQTLYLTDAQNKTNLTEDYLKILKEELNVKEIIQNSNLSEFISYSLKPQLKTLGPRYGKLLNDIRKQLEMCDANSVVQQVKAGKNFKFEINGQPVELSEQDLLISVSQKEGFASASDASLAAIFDTHLTTELINEGLIREFVSKVQALRKSSGFEVTDRINIQVQGNLSNVILKYKDVIAQDVLAVDIREGSKGDYFEEFDLGQAKLKTYLKKA